MANPALASAPAHRVVTLEELKRQLKCSDDENDAHLWGILEAACVYAENFTGRRLVTQTLDLSVDAFPAADYIELSGGDLQSITSLKYTDSSNSETTWDDSKYFAVTSDVPGRLNLAYGISWPSVTLRPRDGIVIRYVVGYGTGDQVPPDLRKAILGKALSMYDNPGDIIVAQGMTKIKLEEAVDNILWFYKLHHF